MNRVDMKVVLLGKEFSGKTSLVERYLYNRFIGQATYQATIGAAFGAKKIDVNGQLVTIGIWDTAGSERYESMSRIYYRDAYAAILCYDVSDKGSFDRLTFWVKELKENEENCRIFLCGTKLDLVSGDRAARQVDYHNVTDYAETINAQVLETSSKTGENIEELFNRIAEVWANDTSRKTKAEDPSKFNLVEKPARRCSTCSL